LIDKMAEVEAWAVERLRRADKAGSAKKLPATSGLRLGAVQKLTDTHPDLFRNAAAAARLLEQLRPYHELRSSLAHSKLTQVQSAEGCVWCIFDRADADAAMPWDGRTAIHQGEFGSIFGQLADLANQILQQTPSSRT
jgi:hypothetical protein